MREKRKRDWKLHFGKMQSVICAFLVLTVLLCIVQRNVSYEKQDRLIEPLKNTNEFTQVTSDTEEQDPECLILWEDDGGYGTMGQEMMEAVLSQMKIPFELCEGEKSEQADFDNYEKIVLSMTNWDLLDDRVLDLEEWVNEGGGLMVLYPPTINGYFQLLENMLGIRSIGDDMEVVESFRLVDNFMLGGDREFDVVSPYESALSVELSEDCTIHMKSVSESPVPLIWSRKAGKGEIVFDNLGFLTKDYRGFYSASYSILGDTCVYPVINSSTFYIDDFPSPVPGGNSKYILENYGMTIEEFYIQIWWNNIYDLAEQYDIRYTGLVIEQYSDTVEAPFERNEDIQRYRYFGNMLLRQGGELGFHGYNHMPLCLVGFDYGDDYDSYRLWESYDDMKESIQELKDFCQSIFPQEEFRVYVPPSNILSDEGRKMLSQEFPELTAIASLYLPGGCAYIQEFEVAEDGIVETPRIISGYLLEEDSYIAALSELNFHYVNSHFQHPDDVLDEERGAKEGWKKLFSNLSEYMAWLYDAAGPIRNLTGTEFAAAVQIYDNLQVKRTETATGLGLRLEGFKDEAWLMLRINTGTPEEIQGGTLEKLQGNLYLLKAEDPDIQIKIS